MFFMFNSMFQQHWGWKKMFKDLKLPRTWQVAAGQSKTETLLINPPGYI